MSTFSVLPPRKVVEAKLEDYIKYNVGDGHVAFTGGRSHLSPTASNRKEDGVEHQYIYGIKKLMIRNQKSFMVDLTQLRRCLLYTSRCV